MLFHFSNTAVAADQVLTFYSDEKIAPKADAGGDKIVYLPVNFVTLDGSMSTDDKEIVSFVWSRDPRSLAAGVSSCTCQHAFMVTFDTALITL